MKNDDFDTYDEPPDEAPNIPDILEDISNETTISKKSQNMYRQASRRRLDDLLEAKKLQIDLNEYDEYISYHHSYYDDDIFSELYKRDPED